MSDQWQVDNAMRDLGASISSYEKAKGGAEKAKAKSEVDFDMLEVIKAGSRNDNDALAVAVARIWSRRDVPSEKEWEDLFDFRPGDVDEAQNNLNINNLADLAHSHIIWHRYMEELEKPVDPNGGPMRANPDLGDKEVTRAFEEVEEDLENVRDDYYAQEAGSEWFARNDHGYRDEDYYEDVEPEYRPPWMPDLDPGPVKDAKTVSPKPVAPSVDQAEVRAALPPGVGLKGSGYDAKYR